MKKLLVVLLALTLVFAFAATALADVSATYSVRPVFTRIGTGDSWYKNTNPTTPSVTIIPAINDTENTVSTADYYVKIGTGNFAQASLDGDGNILITSGLSLGKNDITIVAAKSGASIPSGDRVPAAADVYDTDALTFYFGNYDKQITITPASAVTCHPTNSSTMSYDSANKTYTIHVPSDFIYLDVAFTGVSTNAKITASGATVDPTTGSSVFGGTIRSTSSSFSITVTSQNTVFSDTYSFVVVKDFDVHRLASIRTASRTGTITHNGHADLGTVALTYAESDLRLLSNGKYELDIDAVVNTAKQDTGIVNITSSSLDRSPSTFNSINYDGSLEFTLSHTSATNADYFNNKVFTVQVTAADGTSKNYDVTLTKAVVVPELNGLRFYNAATGGTQYSVSGKTVYLNDANIAQFWVEPVWKTANGVGALNITAPADGTSAVPTQGVFANGRYPVTVTTLTHGAEIGINVASPGTANPTSLNGDYILSRTVSPYLSGAAYVSNSSSSSGSRSFSFDQGGSRSTSISLTDDFSGYYYLNFGTAHSNITSVSVSGTSYSKMTSSPYYYRIPISSSTQTVNIVYSGFNYTLTVNPHTSIVSGKVNDSKSTTSSSGAKSFDFGTSKKKTVNVDEDWDNDEVYLKFDSGKGSSVGTVYVTYKSSDDYDDVNDRDHDVTDDSNGYFEIDLDGTTYVWFRYSNNDYRLTIDPDGTSSEILIDGVDAAEKSNGGGEDYLAFGDNAAEKIYVFKPYDSPSGNPYIRIDTDEDMVFKGDDKDDDDWFRVANGDKVEIDGNEFEVVIKTGGSRDDDNADLKGISVKAGTKKNSLAAVTLSPSFAASTTSYTANIGASNTYAQIQAQLSDSSAYMFINGEMKSGSKAQTWNFDGLKTSTNNFKYTIYVVAENCEDYETYEVTLSRSGGATTLKSLTVSSGSMTPSFSDKIVSYTAYTSMSSITVSAAASDTAANVVIYGTTAASATLGSQSGTGSAYGTFNLAEGLNTFTVTVSRTGATSTTYYVSVYRIPASPKITVSNQNISVNGSPYTLAAYNINGNNFVKLRDLAALLMNTNKRFSVTFDDATQTATMVSGGAYTKRGDELTPLPKYRRYSASSQRFVLDGTYIYPMAFNIDGSNFVMVRDMGSAMNFYVGYTASTKTIIVNTNSGYVPGN